jgi:hypothetical protein
LPAFEGCVSCRAEHTPSVTQPIAGNFGHLRDIGVNKFERLKLIAAAEDNENERKSGAQEKTCRLYGGK